MNGDTPHDAQWYNRQIAGLMMILSQRESDDKFISRQYMLDKLGRIRSGTGVGFHPSIERELDK